MGKKDIDEPKDFDDKIDYLLRNTVVSIARDIEKNFFKGMSEEKIIETVYSKYSGLFMPSGCIETPKRIYRNLYGKYEELIVDEKKQIRGKKRELLFWVYKGTLTLGLVIIGGLIAKSLEIPIKIPGFR